MVTLREAAAKHGTKLLLSLGGNARTNGFPVVAVDKKLRRKLVRNLASSARYTAYTASITTGNIQPTVRSGRGCLRCSRRPRRSSAEGVDGDDGVLSRR